MTYSLFFWSYMKNLIIILFLLFFASCSTPLEKPIVTTKYKLELKIENMGDVQYGLALFKDKPLHTFEFTSKGFMDYFSFNSCSTSITKDEVGGKIFKRKKTKINFRRNQIEIDDRCDVQLDITEKKKQRHTHGYLLFQSDFYKLNANVICGAVTKDYLGTSICQNYAGNKFRISFDEVVEGYSNDCSLDSKKNKWTLETKAGFCNYIFKSKIGEYHRLVTYGWNEELMND